MLSMRNVPYDVYLKELGVRFEHQVMLPYDLTMQNVDEIFDWCWENVGPDITKSFSSWNGKASFDMTGTGDWSSADNVFYFRDATKAIHFKLRWC